MKQTSQNQFIIVVTFTLIYFLVSCNKRNPPVQTVSNSKYNNAFMYIEKQRFVCRNNIGIDSISNNFFIGAGFGDSSNLNAFTDSVGNITIDDFGIIGPMIFGNFPAPYYYQELYATDASIGRFDNAYWKVTSRNKIIDFEYNVGATSYYQDTFPRIITRSAGLTINVNPGMAPNADSVRILLCPAIDTTVSVNAGSIAFSPGKLSALPVINNWNYFIQISVSRNSFSSNNGRGFKIGNYRTVFFGVNIN